MNLTLSGKKVEKLPLVLLGVHSELIWLLEFYNLCVLNFPKI